MFMFTAEKIRELRAQISWSANDLARFLGVCENAVRRWEMGDRHPRWDTITRLNELQEIADKSKGKPLPKPRKDMATAS